MILYVQGILSKIDGEFLDKNYKGQNVVEWLIQGAERKRLSTKNFIANKAILKKMKEKLRQSEVNKTGNLLPVGIP